MIAGDGGMIRGRSGYKPTVAILAEVEQPTPGQEPQVPAPEIERPDPPSSPPGEQPTPADPTPDPEVPEPEPEVVPAPEEAPEPDANRFAGGASHSKTRVAR